MNYVCKTHKYLHIKVKKTFMLGVLNYRLK